MQNRPVTLENQIEELVMQFANDVQQVVREQVRETVQEYLRTQVPSLADTTESIPTHYIQEMDPDVDFIEFRCGYRDGNKHRCKRDVHTLDIDGVGLHYFLCERHQAQIAN